MTNKRSQKLRIIDHFRKFGYVTNRLCMTTLFINNPFQRLKEIRDGYMDFNDIWVRNPNGARFKVFFTNKSKAMKFIKDCGLELA